MNKSTSSRAFVAALLWLALFGGYAAHQYFLLTGRRDAWEKEIAGANLAFGWVVLALSLAYWFFGRDTEAES